MNDDARDPYVGLNDYFGRKAAGAVPSWYAVGRVISTTPLKIRADGLDLDIEDLYIAQHLTAGWVEQLTGLAWPVTSTLPQKIFSGQCKCGLSSGDAWVTPARGRGGGRDRRGRAGDPWRAAEGRGSGAAPALHGWADLLSH